MIPSVLLGTGAIGGCLALYIVSIATKFWAVGEHVIHGNSTKSYSTGLFGACQEEECFSFAPELHSIHDHGSFWCVMIGLMFLVAATCYGVYGLQKPEDATHVLLLLGRTAFIGGLLGGIGCIWSFMIDFEDINEQNYFKSVHPGLSFYLCAFASGVAMFMNVILNRLRKDTKAMTHHDEQLQAARRSEINPDSQLDITGQSGINPEAQLQTTGQGGIHASTLKTAFIKPKVNNVYRVPIDRNFLLDKTGTTMGQQFIT